MNELAQLARSLPHVEPVKVPLATYIEVVKEALQAGDCTLCCVCSEPRWEHNIGGHRCFEVSIYYDDTIEGRL